MARSDPAHLHDHLAAALGAPAGAAPAGEGTAGAAPAGEGTAGAAPAQGPPARDAAAGGDARAPGTPSEVRLGLVLVLAMCVGSFMTAALSVLAPFVVDDLGLTRTQMGSLFTVLFTMATVGSPVLGGVVDRRGARPVLLGLFATELLAILAVAGSPSYGWMLLALALSGLPMAVMNPVTNLVISVNVPFHRQGVLMGIKQSGGQLNWFVAGLGLPAAALAVGWRWALTIGVLLAVLGLVVARTVLDRSPRVEPVAGEVSGPLPIRRSLLWLAAYAFMMALGMASMTSYLPLYAYERVGLSVTQAGLTTAALGFLGVGARVLWGRYADRLRSPALSLLVLSAGAVVAQGFVLGAEWGGPWLLWLGVVAFAVTAGAWATVAMLAVLRLADRASTGRASGVILLGGHGGLVVAPIVFGAIVDASDGSYVRGWTGVIAMFTVAGGIALARLRREGAASRTAAPAG